MSTKPTVTENHHNPRWDEVQAGVFEAQLHSDVDEGKRVRLVTSVEGGTIVRAYEAVWAIGETAYSPSPPEDFLSCDPLRQPSTSLQR
jgi:hypothetical protein